MVELLFGCASPVSSDSLVTAAPTVSVSVSDIPRLEVEHASSDALRATEEAVALGQHCDGAADASIDVTPVTVAETRVGVIRIFLARFGAGAITTLAGPDSHGGRRAISAGGGLSSAETPRSLVDSSCERAISFVFGRV